MNERRMLARVGAILALVSLSIFAIGLLVQITGEKGPLVPLVPGAAGMTLLLSALYLIFLATTPRAGATFVRRAVLVALVLVVTGTLATGFHSDLITTLVIGLVGLQAPIVLALVAGYLGSHHRDH